MLRKPLIAIDDDTEEAPWMVMGTPQFRAVDSLYNALVLEMRRRGENLLVASMLPVRFSILPGGQERTLSPDVMVAPVADGDRPSYDVEQEGAPPMFVLEVISPESQVRDLTAKPGWYERMGVREYALFAPDQPYGRRLRRPQLQGHRMDPSTGEYVPWETDAHGRLYSEVLQLWIAMRDGQLRAQRLDGTWVPTMSESERALEVAERALESERSAREIAERDRDAAERALELAERAREAAEAIALEAQAQLARLRDEAERRDEK